MGFFYGEGFGELGEPGATPGSDMPRLSGRACIACVTSRREERMYLSSSSPRSPLRRDEAQSACPAVTGGRRSRRAGRLACLSESRSSLRREQQFVGRVKYCQRLAARVGGLRGLGFGWRSITFACLGPIFDPDGLSRKVNKNFVVWVFDSLDELRNKLVKHEGNTVAERNRISSVAQLLVSRLSFAAAECTNMLAPAA